MSVRLTLAIETATRYHANRFDGVGLPEILHPLAVMQRVADLAVGRGELPHEEDLIAAVLHDTVEDTDLTLTDIGCLFGSCMELTLDYLTHRENDTYFEYINRMGDAVHRIDGKRAVLVKQADIAVNLARVWSFSQGTPPKSMVERYAKALRLLLK